MHEEIPSSASQGNPWISLGEDAANEDMLTGNRSGLLRLREAIDGALEKEEFFLKGSMGICGVRMLSTGPPKRESPNTYRDRALTLGCLAIALLCGGIFLFGCAELTLKFSNWIR